VEQNEALPKLSMSQALRRVSELLEIIENSTNENQTLQSMFEFVTGNLASAVDRNIECLNVISEGKLSVDPKTGGLIGVARARVERAQRELDRLTNIVASIKMHAKECLQSPGCVALRGEAGEFMLQEGAKHVRLAFDVEKPRSFSNIISAKTVEKYNIPPQYLIVNQFFTVNKEFVEEYLRGGKELSWATLEPSTSVRLKHAKQ
jgi:hypothetical protein